METGETIVNVLEGAAAVRYAEDVRKLYVEVGWLKTGDPAEYLPEMLKNTFRIACAVDSAGHLVGFMRALSDGVSDAYLLDMAVLPDHRRKGLADKILNSLVGELQSKGIDWIVCISVPGVENLYLKRGTRMAGHTPVRFL